MQAWNVYWWDCGRGQTQADWFRLLDLRKHWQTEMWVCENIDRTCGCLAELQQCWSEEAEYLQWPSRGALRLDRVSGPEHLQHFCQLGTFFATVSQMTSHCSAGQRETQGIWPTSDSAEAWGTKLLLSGGSLEFTAFTFLNIISYNIYYIICLKWRNVNFKYKVQNMMGEHPSLPQITVFISLLDGFHPCCEIYVI